MSTLTINLLPWREVRRLKKKKQAYFVFSVLLFAFWILLLSERYALLEIKETEEQDYCQLNNNLKNIEKFFQNKERTDQLKLQEEVILNKLNKKVFDNKRVIFLLDKIAKIIPKDVSLEKIEKQNNKILLTGHASSEEGILAFLKAIKEEENRIQILEIKKTDIKKHASQNEFKFNIPIKHLTLIDDEKLSKQEIQK